MHTYAEGEGVVKRLQVRTRRKGGSKLEILLRTYFLEAPLVSIPVGRTGHLGNKKVYCSQSIPHPTILPPIHKNLPCLY